MFDCQRLEGVWGGLEEAYRGSIGDGGDRGNPILEEPKDPSEDSFCS